VVRDENLIPYRFSSCGKKGASNNQNWNCPHGFLAWVLAERPGSGDGERKTLLTRQIAFEPLPASVLLGLDLESLIVRYCYSPSLFVGLYGSKGPKPQV
jgi:hypothetical protein